MEYIEQFTSDIQFVHGSNNTVADLMSRLPDINVLNCADINIATLYKEQESDCELIELLQKDRTKYNLKLVTISNNKTNIWCEISGTKFRPYVLLSLRTTIFKKLHSISHPGVKASRKLIQSKYFWPSLRKDVNHWTLNCVQCQRSKIWRHTKTPVNNIHTSNNRFEHIHMDIVGPLPISNNHRYLLTIVDRFTRWREVYPMKDILTSTICKTFVENYLPRFGIPLHIRVDQGTQFTSRLFSELTTYLEAHKIHTTTYHPQANGIVERFHRQLKAAIIASQNPKHWFDELPYILLGLRTTVKEDLKSSPAELVYGEALPIPGELIVTDPVYVTEEETINKLRQHFSKIRSKCIHHDTKRPYIPPDLETCKYVYVRNFFRKGFEPPYQGPFEIISKNPHTFTIKKGIKNVDVAIDNIKPAIIEKMDEIPSSHSKQTNTFIVN